MKPIRFLYPIFLLLLTFPGAAQAVIEVARSGGSPVSIADVYHRDGTSFVAIDEVLAALKIQGDWDSVDHVYRIKAPRGTAVISPGSHYMRVGERFVPMEEPPRFIDGYLRVSESFVTRQVPHLIGEPIYYRNLHPRTTTVSTEEESPLDRLFSFLLRKKKEDVEGPRLRGVALDPGHGGQDAGTISSEGDTEKAITLSVSRRLEKLLKMRLGIPVYLSRDGDYTLTPEQRLAPAGRSDADALVLLHAQGALSPEPRGVSLLIRPREEAADGDIAAGPGESLRLALHLESALREAGFTVTGIRRAPLVPLGRGDLPTVLVELGFLSNPADRTLLVKGDGQESIAEALYAGLKKFADDEKEAIQ